MPMLDTKPSGLLRLLLRLPTWLYRIGLGWTLGGRFLLLQHIGRKSGLQRETVLEVVWSDPPRRAYVVVAAWGARADWSRT